MSFKQVLVVIGIVFLVFLITFGVEELRFIARTQGLKAEIRILEKQNQQLEAELQKRK